MKTSAVNSTSSEGTPPMLSNPTVDRLRALRLEGMVEALEEQRCSAAHADLDFEERLALLVERQWLWRTNRALATRLQQAQPGQWGQILTFDNWARSPRRKRSFPGSLGS
ncbi:MAG: ATP-binding protein [Verrucomicrobiota bacterium]